MLIQWEPKIRSTYSTNTEYMVVIPLNISIEVKNLNKVLNNLTKEVSSRVDSIKEDNLKLAEEILEEAKRLCPVDTGELRDSGRVVKVDKAYKVEFTAKYAVYVHENLSIKHERGQAQFLTQAIINVKRRRGLK